MAFNPTHRITLDSGRSFEVSLDTSDSDDGSGPAFTREEWDSCSTADFCVDGGEWLFQGRAFAGIVETLGAKPIPTLTWEAYSTVCGGEAQKQARREGFDAMLQAARDYADSEGVEFAPGFEADARHELGE